MKDRLANVSSKVAVTAITFSGFVTSVFAEDPSSWLPDRGTSGNLGPFVQKILNWAIGLAALAAVVMLIAAGFLYITAAGDENNVGKATKTLTFAIVGLVVCFIAVMVVNFVLVEFLR